MSQIYRRLLRQHYYCRSSRLASARLQVLAHRRWTRGRRRRLRKQAFMIRRRSAENPTVTADERLKMQKELNAARSPGVQPLKPRLTQGPLNPRSLRLRSRPARGEAARWHRQAGTSSRDFRSHRQPKSEVVHCDNCSVLILEFAMNDVVERILHAYQSMCPLDAERAADSRQKISRYIESLASAGQRDAEQLTIYGLAYLTELHEGQDPRFTGC
jgi:hypothetical protein